MFGRDQGPSGGSLEHFSCFVVDGARWLQNVCVRTVGWVVILGFFGCFFFFHGGKQRQGKHEDVGLAEDTLFDRKKIPHSLVSTLPVGHVWRCNRVYRQIHDLRTGILVSVSQQRASRSSATWIYRWSRVENLLFYHCCSRRGWKKIPALKKLIRYIPSHPKATRKRYLSVTELELVKAAEKKNVGISSTQLHRSSGAAGDLEYIHKCMNTWRWYRHIYI